MAYASIIYETLTTRIFFPLRRSGSPPSVHRGHTHRDAYVGVVAAPSVAVGDTVRNRRGATGPSFRGQRAGAAPVLRPSADLSRRARLVGAGSVLASLPPSPGDDCVAGPASIDMGRYRGIRAADPGTQYRPRRDYHARAYRNHGLQQGFAEREKSGIAAMPREDPSGSALAGGLTRPLGCGRLPAERDYQLLRSVLRYVAQSL